MILLRLYVEFFLIGLFSVGGGLATIPFLRDLGERTGWFTMDQLTDMIAISESTPGPLGVNMASYVGFEVGGVPGAAIATLGLITPCLVIILIIARCLARFRHNAGVEAVFYGLRPASAGLIAAAGWTVVCLALVRITWEPGTLLPSGIAVQWPCLALAAVVFAATHLRWTKKLHPIVWIVLSGIAGAAFGL